MTTAAWCFLGIVWTCIFTGIFVALRKILKHEANK